MSWVWDNSRSTGADRLVILAIADAANDAGRDAYPSMATIARKANLDKRTAQRAVRNLQAMGELAVLENAGPHGTHRYRLIMTERRQDTTRGDTPPPVADDHHGDTPPVAPDPAGGGISSQEGRSVATRTVLNPSTTRPKETSAKTADPPSAELVPIRQDVERICTRLADRIEQNGSKRPRVTTKWRDAARLLIDKDGRTEQQVVTAIDWCQTDDFWRANVLSLPTLRDKYDRLRLAALQRQHDRPGNRRAVDDHLLRAAHRMGATP